MKQRTDLLDFSAACAHLGLSPDAFTSLREEHLIGSVYVESRHLYSLASLNLTQKLLSIGDERGWPHPTLAIFADLLLAAEVGRSLLLPFEAQRNDSYIDEWLATGYVEAVLASLDKYEVEGYSSSPVVTLLRSLVVSLEEQDVSLESSSLYPLVLYFEEANIPVLGQKDLIARDAGSLLLVLVTVFTSVVLPASQELADLVSVFRSRIIMQSPVDPSKARKEIVQIKRERLVAVDRVYASRATEIHTPPEKWEVGSGVIVANKPRIRLKMEVPVDATDEIIDNIIDLVKPYLGVVGAQVIQMCYQIANDAPYWRSPVIDVSTNELLDKLGYKRDARGVHRSKNREGLRDILNAAHALEIYIEEKIWQDSRLVIRQHYSTMLSILGADFDAGENAGISAAELRERGLPRHMRIRLNFYNGVRRTNGQLGDRKDYVLMPRLESSEKRTSGRHAGTYELTKAYLALRARQADSDGRVIVERSTLLEKVNIHNKNSRQATLTLRKALDQLVEHGLLRSYTTPLPTRPDGLIELTVSDALKGP